MDLPRRILVLEDDDDAREALGDVLEERGYEVELFAAGSAALSRLARAPAVDLILFDLISSEMDGFEFRKKQLADPELREVPALVMSGSSDIAGIAALLKTRGFLHKPFQVTALVRALERCFTSPSADP